VMRTDSLAAKFWGGPPVSFSTIERLAESDHGRVQQFGYGSGLVRALTAGR
jgi:hypothetical protein